MVEREPQHQIKEIIKPEKEFLLDFLIHEISSIHDVTLGFLELLEDQGGRKDEFIWYYLEPVRRNLKRSQALIEQVKLFSSARAVSSDSFIPFNLVGAIRRSIEVITQMFPHHDLEFHTNYTSEKCPILADSLLDFILINLLNNAVKYDSHVSKKIDIVVEDTPDCWQVSITDRGDGIPDELKPMLFKRVLRIPRNRKRHGVGLGLFIVGTLVEKFGGKIWVENRVSTNPTKGSRFVCLFPKI